MPFKKGENGNSGPKKKGKAQEGIVLKEMALEALVEVGGVDYLVQQAQENPSAYLTYLGKFVTKEVEATVSMSHEDALNALDDIVKPD